MSSLSRTLKRPVSRSIRLIPRRRLASTVAFDWTDPLNSKALLSSEELDIQDTARSYCQERLLPRVLSARDEIRKQNAHG